MTNNTDPDYDPVWDERLPPADEQLIREHAEELRTLAARYRFTDLRYASPGRLVGHPGEDKPPYAALDFEIAAVRLLGRNVDLFSDKVLSNQGVSPDLLEAQPL